MKKRFVVLALLAAGALTLSACAPAVQAPTWGSTAKTYEDLAKAGAVPLHTVAPTTAPFAKDRGYPPLGDRRQ